MQERRETRCSEISIEWDNLYTEGNFKWGGVCKNRRPRSHQPYVAKMAKVL